MLTGEKLGQAIKAAIEKKAVTQRSVAAHFGVKPPSIQDWIRRGTIGKEKLPELWRYFDDVAGPEHWGLDHFPTQGSYAMGTVVTAPSHGSTFDIDTVPPQQGAVEVPRLATSTSMGLGGGSPHEEVMVGNLSLSPQWVSKAIPNMSKSQNLRFIHGYGDSMQPTFSDGDVLLVDAGATDVRADGVYVIEANDRLYIKRVRQRMDGSFEISSDNATVKTVDVLNGSQTVRVLGRVVWVWNGKKI